MHTVRELLRTVRGTFQQRWAIDGFSGASRTDAGKQLSQPVRVSRRHRQPPTSDESLMNELVWVGGDEPAWAVGGSVPGRADHPHARRVLGPGGPQRAAEHDRSHARHGSAAGGDERVRGPRYDLDPHGKRIPLDAHIRLANPRTAATAGQRILRRGFNYDRGFDSAGQLDQGLVFVAYNQSPSGQFVPIQERLNSEPMTDYITPVGGGSFFVPPGAQGDTGFVGDGLFA